MDLNALRVFERVAATGSFTAAARHFHRSVSSISRQVAALERSLNVQLLYRHTRAVSLTEAGRRYYEEVRVSLERLDQATEALTQPAASLAGTLRLNCPVAFGRHQVVPVLNDFQRRYPDVHVELLLTDGVVDPVREGLDVTFRVGELADSSLVARPLAPMRYVTAAAPSYLATVTPPVHPEDLQGLDCLLYQGEMGRQRWYFRRADETMSLHLSGPLYSNDAESLLLAAEQGRGIVTFPTWLLAASLRAGRLVPLLGDWECDVAAERRMIHVLSTEGRRRSAKVQAFMEHLFAWVGEEPPWDRWHRP